MTDRATRAPFDPARGGGPRFRAAGLANGIALYPSAGTVDGVRGDHVIVAPPYIVTAEQVDEIVDRLGRTLEAALVA